MSDWRNRERANRLDLAVCLGTAAVLLACIARGQETNEPDWPGLIVALKAPAAASARPVRAAVQPAAVVHDTVATNVVPARVQPALPAKLRASATVQIALDRHGFGCGLIDGREGLKSRQALLDFRYASGATNDAAARQALLAEPDAAFVHYTVTSNDWAQVGDAPSDWEQAAELPAMACRTLLEWISERTHASQGFLRLINPQVADWDSARAGAAIWVPNVRPSDQKLDVAQIAIETHCYRLRGFDARGCLVCSFPCSIARDRTKVPSGELTVANVAPNPNYTFDPENFPESARAKAIGRKLILPPGPRNPVGVYWMSLSQPGYGIHGTPHPETIGNMESHGCFRLCNWDAHALGQVVTLGLPVLLDAPPRVMAQH